jgi:septation ring formation regulator EzrA
MSFHVLPFGADASITKQDAVQPARRLRSDEADAAAFAQVYDASVLESARAARRARESSIPAHVMDEMQAAARLYDDLVSRRQSVRFDLHDLDGRVVADLVDADGNVVRPISLRDIIESNDPDAAA